MNGYAVTPSKERRNSRCLQWKVRVETSFRDELLALYPALKTHPHREFFLRLAQFHLWGGWKDTLTDDSDTGKETEEPRLVLPAEYIAEFAGVSADTRGFSAEKLVREFERHVWPLDLSPDWSYAEGRARTISPELPADVRALLAHRRLDVLPWEETCWFVSGKRITRHSHDKAKAALLEHLDAMIRETPENHPARALLCYFNQDSRQVALRRLVGNNLGRLAQAYHQMPENTPRDRRRKRQVGAVIEYIRDYPELRYRGTWKSPRIFPLGLSVLALPRKFRDLALTGCIKFDMRSCQLGIVAGRWNIPSLKTFLTNEGNIWRELTAHIGVDTRTFKPVVKRAVFSVVFGMKITRVKSKLLTDDDEGALVSPMTAPQAEALLTHPLLVDLINARQRVLCDINKAGGMRDCFGFWHPVQWAKDPKRKGKRRRDPCAVLASCVQAVEMRLLLSMLRVFEAERSAVLVATIHDGIAVKFTDETERERITQRLKQTLNKAANRLGVYVKLEVED